jgi:hypothetical protein
VNEQSEVRNGCFRFPNYAGIFKTMSILILLQAACLISLFNHVWFKTDVFAFYAKLLKKLIPQKVYLYLLMEEYFNRPPEDYIYDSYIGYFFSKRIFSNNFTETFILKLISCPLCTSFWLCLAASLLTGNIFNVGILFILVRFFDSLLNFFLKMH